jgi:hypothetical protein
MKIFLSLKKLCLTSASLFIITVANAQQSDSPQFSAYVSATEKTIRELSKNNDYKQLVQIYSEWTSKYQQQQPAVQQQFKGYLPNMYYNLACYQALTNDKPGAISSFEKSVNVGYSNYATTLKDTDLDGLRKDPKFIALMQKMREKGDYGYILKMAGPYQPNKERNLPAFAYQPATSPVLTAFKAQYNLDSISGKGDEISKFKNLLFWVHNIVRHDGNSNNPPSKNAVDLIAICKKENRGINCRMMATILKDAYQAMGYPSRVVTCLPKDINDPDCHVITVVWSKQKQKWIWMDPTFNAYVSDDKGNLLNIEEVRTRLIANKPLILNEDANWNNQNKQTKAQYLDYYMSKNLYWIKIATSSEWDLETSKPDKKVTYINLYPGNFTTMKELTKTTGNTTEYATNDPIYFWQKPVLTGN